MRLDGYMDVEIRIESPKGPRDLTFSPLMY